jgi:phage I-like protein
MSFWKKRADGSMEPADNNSLADIEFKPEQLEAKITENFNSSIEKLRAEQQESLKPLQEMAAAIMAERAERAAKAQRERDAKNHEDNQVSAEDYLLDPEAATRKQLQPVARATMILAAKMAKQETLGEKEYYHGDIKSKVDAMLANQPLESQTRPDVIENCYKLVMFDHMDAVRDGKIKSRNTSAIFEGGSTGAHSAKEGGETETLSAEEKQVAKLMDISEKEWIASRKELQYV